MWPLGSLPALTITETVQLAHSPISSPDLFPFGHPAQWHFWAGVEDEVEAQGFQQSRPAAPRPLFSPSTASATEKGHQNSSRYFDAASFLFV